MKDYNLINRRATTCRHGGHCEWVACDKCNHYEPKPETITNSTSGYLEVVLPECEDCISRQEAINCVTSNEFRYRMVEDIKTLLSVTPKEKTGHWIKVTNGRGGHECDLCHEYAPSYRSGDEYLTKYCPNCGARMVSE